MSDQPDTIILTPNWEATCEWFALVLIQHGFDRNARGPVISFIEQARYLALTDPQALERVLERIRRASGRSHPVA
jgi:hypothetical protein